MPIKEAIWLLENLLVAVKEDRTDDYDVAIEMAIEALKEKI